MNSQTSLGSQKVSAFRSSIRRKYIEQIFQKQRIQFNGFSNQQQQIVAENQTTNNNNNYQNILNNINQNYTKNQTISITQLKTLVMMSQNLLALQKLKNAPFITGLSQFIELKYLDTEIQFYSTFILCNIFYAVEKGSLVISNDFMMKIYELLMNTANVKIKQNCLIIIFHIVIDIQERNLDRMVTECDPDTNLISVIHRFALKGELGQSLVRQILRIFHTAARRLKYPRNQHFSRMRKIIIIAISSAQNSQILYLGLLCLGTLLTCIPEQCNFSNTNKSIIIQTILTRFQNLSQSSQVSPLTINILKQIIKILNLVAKSLECDLIKKRILPFIYKVLQKQKKGIYSPGSCQLAYSLIYTFIYEMKIDLNQFIVEYHGLFLILVQIFLDEQITQRALIQLIYLMGLIYGKTSHYFIHNQKIGPQFHKIHHKFIKILNQNTLSLDNSILNFIEQTLAICSNEIQF